MVDNRNRSKNQGDFTNPVTEDFPPPAYTGRPGTKATNDSLSGIIGEHKEIGMGDPRPEDPREPARRLMSDMDFNSNYSTGSSAGGTQDRGSSTPRNNLPGYGR